MAACDSHVEVVSQLFFCKLYAVQQGTGRALANRVHMDIQSRSIQFFKNIRKFPCIETGSAGLTGVRIRRDHGGGMDLLRAVHQNL